MPHHNDNIVLIVIIYSPENCLMVLALQCNKYNTLSHLLSQISFYSVLHCFISEFILFVLSSSYFFKILNNFLKFVYWQNWWWEMKYMHRILQSWCCSNFIQPTIVTLWSTRGILLHYYTWFNVYDWVVNDCVSFNGILIQVMLNDFLLYFFIFIITQCYQQQL